MMIDEEREIYAVRWVKRRLHKELRDDFTRWHASYNGAFTVCGLAIPITGRGFFLPETEDDLKKVDCWRCQRVRLLFGQYDCGCIYGPVPLRDYIEYCGIHGDDTNEEFELNVAILAQEKVE